MPALFLFVVELHKPRTSRIVLSLGDSNKWPVEESLLRILPLDTDLKS